MKSILIIDDEEDILDFMTEILGNEGYKVMPMSSGESAINLLENNIPDLILLDLMLQGMSGLEFLKLLKSDERLSNIPVIIVTCKKEIRDKILGLQGGAVDYISKPFTHEKLIKRVKAILGE